MSMTSPEDIENWFNGTQFYDTGNIQGALKKFGEVTQNSRILFNTGCCNLTLNEIDKASENYKNAVENDQHLAIGYFMVGLTSFLQKKYEEAMKSFTRSLELLRGNRCVDYKQLGLKYQLYSCEILTNQAVMAYHLNQIDEAKNYLLRAVGCKAEKRHEGIFEMLISLQAGFEIKPFVLPKNRIFRPPKSYVQNLKKKDFLGKAKVITTDSEDDIFACFSGIKDEVAQAAKENEQKKQQSDSQQPVPVQPIPTARPRQMARSMMLTELRKPDRKKTLKKTIVKRRENPIAVGNVVNSSENKASEKAVPKRRPKSPCPPRKSSDASGIGFIPIHPDLSQRKSTSSVPGSDSEDYLSESQSSLNSSTNSLSRMLMIAKSQQNPRLSMPEIKSLSLQKPTKKPPSLPGVSSLDRGINPRRFSESAVDKDAEKRLSLTLQKPVKKPPPLVESKEENEKHENGIIEENVTTLEETIVENQPEDEVSNQNRVEKETIRRKKTNDPSKKKVKKVEVEVQYTFIKKLKIPVGSTLEKVHDILKNVRIPDQIELCFTDDLGRQKTLDENNIHSVIARTSKTPKLLCFPE